MSSADMKPITPEKETTIYEAPDPLELTSTFDQTRFTEESVMDGGSRSSRPVEAASRVAEVPKKKRDPRIILMAVLGVLALVVLPLMSIFTRQVVQTRNGATASPTPNVEATGNQSELEKRLILLEQDVATADPIQLDLAYPPVNFELDLLDATSKERLEQERSTRQR